MEEIKNHQQERHSREKAELENTEGGFITASENIENPVNQAPEWWVKVTKISRKSDKRWKKVCWSASTTAICKPKRKSMLYFAAIRSCNNAKKDYDHLVEFINEQPAQKEWRYDARWTATLNKVSVLKVRNKCETKWFPSFRTRISRLPFRERRNQYFRERRRYGKPRNAVGECGRRHSFASNRNGFENNIASIKRNGRESVGKIIQRQSNRKVSEVSSSATNTGGQYLVKINLDKNEFVCIILECLLVVQVFRWKQSSS